MLSSAIFNRVARMIDAASKNPPPGGTNTGRNINAGTNVVESSGKKDHR